MCRTGYRSLRSSWDFIRLSQSTFRNRQDYDGAFSWAFSLFAMGLTSAVTYGHHEKRNAKPAMEIALLTLAFLPLSPWPSKESSAYSWLLLSPYLAALGGWVGFLIQNRPASPQPPPRPVATFLLMGRGKTLPEAPLFAVHLEMIDAPPGKHGPMWSLSEHHQQTTGSLISVLPAHLCYQR